MPPQTEYKGDEHNLESNPAGADAMFVLIALAFASGFADAASYLLTGSFTGLITGNTVLGAIALAAGKIDSLWLHFSAVVAFLLATAGGILLPRLGLKKNGTLALALLIEAALVAIVPLSPFSHESHTRVFMLVCMCLALGLQNGVFRKSKGVSVHLTYLSGDATLLIASLLRPPDAPKKSPDTRTTNTVLGVIWPIFAVGAALAGLAVHYLGARALWLLEVPLLLATISAWESASRSPTTATAK